MSLKELGLLVVGFGAALIVVAQLARRRGDALKRAGVTPFAAANAKSIAERIELFFLGPQPRAHEDVVRVFAVGVFVFVIVVVAGLGVAFLYARMSW
jgi:hypothetical protein